jgi:hypothetical protein
MFNVGVVVVASWYEAKRHPLQDGGDAVNSRCRDCVNSARNRQLRWPSHRDGISGYKPVVLN